MTLIEGYAVISTNEEGFKFFLALFNYEEEANEYIAKFPEENLSVVFTSAEFEDELFEVLEDVDFDIELEEFLEEYGFELTQIDFGFALFENVDEDFDIIVNLKDKTFDSSIMPDYIKQGIEELGYTAYNDEEPFGKLGSKEDKVERLPKCCICGSDIEGYGNNPAPVAGKCCCDKCNNNVIVPYRLFIDNLGKNNCGLLVKKDSLELITPKKDKFTLSELQKFVGGYIEEEAQILKGYITFADEEGKLKNKEFNELGYKLFETDLVGDFIIVPRKLVD